MLPYADTDFFLALIKSEDRLKNSALQKLNQFKGRIWTSSASVIECLFVTVRAGLDPEIIVGSIFQIAAVIDLPQSVAFKAAHFIKHDKVNVLDAFHAAFSEEDQIISSDTVYDKLGLKRIPL